LFRRCGPVDHVVVTAAQLRTGPFKTVAMEDVRGTMEGKFMACREKRGIRPGGSLTLVSGFLSVRPRPNSAIVSAANGALESLSRALALELAPVRVNCISPGIVDTPIRAAMPEEARRDMLAKAAAALPAGRVGMRSAGYGWTKALGNGRSPFPWRCRTGLVGLPTALTDPRGLLQQHGEDC
jgi:NAD(P)-dependent dehydrogenase (short-subunit alcohol dehydrogenase family)